MVGSKQMRWVLKPPQKGGNGSLMRGGEARWGWGAGHGSQPEPHFPGDQVPCFHRGASQSFSGLIKMQTRKMTREVGTVEGVSVMQILMARESRKTHRIAQCHSRWAFRCTLRLHPRETGEGCFLQLCRYQGELQISLWLRAPQLRCEAACRGERSDVPHLMAWRRSCAACHPPARRTQRPAPTYSRSQPAFSPRQPRHMLVRYSHPALISFYEYRYRTVLYSYKIWHMLVPYSYGRTSTVPARTRTENGTTEVTRIRVLYPVRVRYRTWLAASSLAVHRRSTDDPLFTQMSKARAQKVPEVQSALLTSQSRKC